MVFVVLSGVAAFHYFVWGRWLGDAIRREVEEEEREKENFRAHPHLNNFASDARLNLHVPEITRLVSGLPFDVAADARLLLLRDRLVRLALHRVPLRKSRPVTGMPESGRLSSIWPR